MLVLLMELDSGLGSCVVFFSVVEGLNGGCEGSEEKKKRKKKKKKKGEEIAGERFWLVGVPGKRILRRLCRW